MQDNSQPSTVSPCITHWAIGGRIYHRPFAAGLTAPTGSSLTLDGPRILWPDLSLSYLEPHRGAMEFHQSRYCGAKKNRAIEIVDLPKKGWFSILPTDSCHKKGWLIWGSFYDMKIWHKATEDLGGFVSSSYRMMFSTRLSGFCHGFDPWPTWKLASPCLAAGPPLVGVLGQRACIISCGLHFSRTCVPWPYESYPYFIFIQESGFTYPLCLDSHCGITSSPKQKATVLTMADTKHLAVECLLDISSISSGYVKIAIEATAIEIVSLPMKHGDFPLCKLLTFTRGYWIYPLVI